VATFSEIQTVGEKAVATYFDVAMLHLSEWIEENNENPPSGRLVEQDTI
jgi:hypothetical protein